MGARSPAQLSTLLCIFWPNLGNLASSGRPEGIVRLRRYIVRSIPLSKRDPRPCLRLSQILKRTSAPLARLQNMLDAASHFAYAHVLLAAAVPAFSQLPVAEQVRVLTSLSPEPLQDGADVRAYRNTLSRVTGTAPRCVSQGGTRRRVGASDSSYQTPGRP